MAITNGYCTLADLKTKIGIATATTTYDSDLEKVVESVSRMIDNDRNRKFFTTEEARYFTPLHSDHIYVDDLVSITTLEVAVNVARTYTEWDTDNYDIEPLNNTPNTSIHTAPSSARYFVRGLRKSVKITGVWGYASSIPSQIRDACLLLAQHVWFLKDTPLGRGGSDSIMGELYSNPDMIPTQVKGLLAAIPKRVRL